MADVPDFGALAYQQQGLNDQATNKTNLANRPNQYNPMGSTVWGMNPDGSWGQTTNLTGAAQGLFNTTMAGQQNLGSMVGAGAPQASFGAQQNIIDAWNALQQPGLQKSADAARARAAAMGLTIGSNANNDIERTIGTNEATSRNQGILQGVDAYNKMYQNQLAGFNANKDAMTAFTGVRDSLNPNKWSPDFKSSAAFVPANIYAAAGDTLAANMANENAGRADTNSWISGAGSLINAAGGLSGIGSFLGDAWSGAKGLWDSWNSGGEDVLGDFISANGWV